MNHAHLADLAGLDLWRFGFGSLVNVSGKRIKYGFLRLNVPQRTFEYFISNQLDLLLDSVSP